MAFPYNCGLCSRQKYPQMTPVMQAPYQQGGQFMPSQMVQPALPQLPSGMPTGPSYTSPVPVAAQVGELEAPPETVASKQYTQGFLKSMIGNKVKVEFLIGTNMLVDREGTLVDVGISYIIIREVETDDLLLCDMYSIKFVRFYF